MHRINVKVSRQIWQVIDRRRVRARLASGSIWPCRWDLGWWCPCPASIPRDTLRRSCPQIGRLAQVGGSRQRHFNINYYHYYYNNLNYSGCALIVQSPYRSVCPLSFSFFWKKFLKFPYLEVQLPLIVQLCPLSFRNFESSRWTIRAHPLYSCFMGISIALWEITYNNLRNWTIYLDDDWLKDKC